MKTCIIIQARITSTRFANKVFTKINDKYVIDYIIEECLKVKNVEVVLIVPSRQGEFFEDARKKFNINLIEGDEHDVLSRYYNAAIILQCDTIIRVSSDCVLMSADVIEKTLD